MYKKASRLKLRFATNKGSLTVEQLWTLSLNDLKSLIRNLYELNKKTVDQELSFLEEEVATEDTEDKLRSDIAVDIYKTKQAELAERRNEAEKRAFNQHIDEIIAEKKEADLRGKSIEELEAMRRK